MCQQKKKKKKKIVALKSLLQGNYIFECTGESTVGFSVDTCSSAVFYVFISTPEHNYILLIIRGLQFSKHKATKCFHGCCAYPSIVHCYLLSETLFYSFPEYCLQVYRNRIKKRLHSVSTQFRWNYLCLSHFLKFASSVTFCL